MDKNINVRWGWLKDVAADTPSPDGRLNRRAGRTEILQRLILLGIDDSTPPFERRNISVINLLSTAFFLFFFLYDAIVFAYFEQSLIPVFLCFVVYQSGLLATLGLHWRGKIAFARHFFITHTFLLVTLVSLLLGRDSMFHFYLLSCFFTCYYIFPRSQRNHSYVWCLLFFLAFCLVELWRANPFIVHMGSTGFLTTIKTFTVVAGLTSVIFIKASISTHMLHSSEAKIEEEQQKVDRLLYNTLPMKVVAELKEFGVYEPREHDRVTIFFSDIADFTGKASRLEPRILIEELNAVFTTFDLIFERHHCERIKTIGDAYMAACGIDKSGPKHCANVLLAAAEAVAFMEERNKKSSLQWKLRVGVHTGKVVGGIVGVWKYVYDLFGDTINTAQRMESNGEPMRINVSEAVYQLEKDRFVFTERTPVNVKGKGEMRMYWLDGEKAHPGAALVDG